VNDVCATVEGSCLGNPGPGASACLLRYVEQERTLQGGIARTTNNRMEMIAAIEGLRALTRLCEVVVVTDSDYLRCGMTEFPNAGGPIGGRRRLETRSSIRIGGRELDELAGYHPVTWIHGGGHSGHADQERCDALAFESARQRRQDSAAEC
jgi:ribonuclease HI